MDEENVREYQDVREYQEKKSGVRKGILFGVLSTILVGLIGINLVCYATGTQIVITPKMSSKGSVVDTDTLVKINELTAYVDTYFYEEVDREKLRDGLYSGLLEGIGDKYSVYYNADEYQQMQIDTTGKYYGIGAGLTQDKDTMVVTISKVYEGTPSEAAGLMAEDIILSVDDIEATSMEVTDLVKEIRGEEGTTVHLEIYRPSTGEYLSFDVERANVVLPSISSECFPMELGISGLNPLRVRRRVSLKYLSLIWKVRAWNR